MVVRADRDAAGDDQHVGVEPGVDGRAGGLEVVRDDAVVGDDGAPRSAIAAA